MGEKLPSLSRESQSSTRLDLLGRVLYYSQEVSYNHSVAHRIAWEQSMPLLRYTFWCCSSVGVIGNTCSLASHSSSSPCSTQKRKILLIFKNSILPILVDTSTSSPLQPSHPHHPHIQTPHWWQFTSRRASPLTDLKTPFPHPEQSCSSEMCAEIVMVRSNVALFYWNGTDSYYCHNVNM